MRKLARLLTIIVLWLAVCHLALAEYEPQETETGYAYHWGRGLSLPAANLTIGGYFKGAYEGPEKQRDAVALDDLSLFITWTPHARLRFFTEIEPHDWINSRDGVRPFAEALNIERLFVDFLITGTSSVRLGKFLTPFGRWNVIHSAPLVWTTSHPVVTDKLFLIPRANGVMFNHSRIVNDHNLDIALYLDNSANLEPKTFDNITFDKAAGMHINYELSEEVQFGASYLAYQNPADLDLPVHHLWGADFLWQHQGYEVMLESLYHLREGGNTPLEEKGLYVQGVVPLPGKLFAVGRYEYFNTNAFAAFNSDDSSHVGVAGIAWRPFLPLVFKTEYRFGDNNKIIAPNGLFVSIAMFF